MKIKINDKIPNTKIFRMQDGQLEKSFLYDHASTKKIILLGVPGAFTPTCSNEHLPSYVKKISEFKNVGIDQIICLVVNDLYIAELWEKKTGARDAGLKVFADTQSEFAKKTGLIFSAPDIGFINRLQRFVMVVEDCIIKKIYTEEIKGVCELTHGENVLKNLL